MSEKSEKSEKCVNVASKHLRKSSQMRETSAFMFLAVPDIDYCLVTDYTRSLRVHCAIVLVEKEKTNPQKGHVMT